MRIRCLIGFALLSCFFAGGAHGDTIGVYADNSGTECNITDNTQTLLSIYVVHKSPQGAWAAQFSAPMPVCMTGATWLSDSAAYEVIGSSQTGVAIGYGICATGPIHFLTINYFAQGTSDPCCLYAVLPDPDVPSGQIEVVDCNGQLLYAQGEVSTVNGDASCPCGYPVAVEETTWGKVKSLYVE